MQIPANFENLIEKANQFNLYTKLIVQLNKDLLYANIDLVIDETTSPICLKSILHQTLYKLIQEKFSEYLNFLYIVDVSERKVKALEGNDIVKLSEEVTFLILLREWQKVWFKNQF